MLEERLRAGESLTLYAHGGGRELSTKQWDDYKEPVAEVVDASWRDAAEKLAEALRFYLDGCGDIDCPPDCREKKRRARKALAEYDRLTRPAAGGPNDA